MTLSASRFRLATLCSYWARPEVPRSDTDSTYAAKGRAFHALAEGRTVENVPDDVRAWADAWRASRWSQAAWLHEVGFAYDPATDTARLVPGRPYPDLRPGEVPGTADLVRAERDSITVGDLKTGWQATREPVEVHAQLRFLALCAARAYGIDRVRVVLIDVAEDVAATDDVLDDVALDAVAAQVRAVVAAIPDARPAPGAHCAGLYCPAIVACPAAAAMTDALARVEPAAVTITAENAAAVLLRYEIVTKRADVVREALKAWVAEHGPIESDGRRWGPTTAKIETLALDGPEGAEARALLARAGVPVRESVKWGDVPKDVREALRATGAVRVTEQTRHEWRKAKA